MVLAHAEPQTGNRKPRWLRPRKTSRWRNDVMNITTGYVLERDGSKQRSPHRTTAQRADELPDEQLMARLDGPGVEAAISALYDRYSRTVFGVGLNILGDRSLAEELVQEVFLKVWRSSGTFDPSRGSFSTWLFRITRSAALDLYRKRARRIRPEPYGDSHVAITRDSSAGPQEIAEESWLSWRISSSLV